jgi:surface antigen
MRMRLRLVAFGASLSLALGACQQLESLTGGSWFSGGLSAPSGSGAAATEQAAPAAMPPPGPGVSEAALTAALFGSAGLSEADMAQAAQAVQRATIASPRVAIYWSNPESGRGGAVTVLRYGYDRDDRPCREFGSTIEGGRSAQVVACRDANGIWRPRGN